MTKRISDLLDTYSDPNIELQIKTPLSSERIKELTMKKITKTAKTSPRILRRVLIVAAVIASVVLTVFAVDVVTGGAWFRTFFESNTEAELTQSQIDYIEENAVMIDDTQTVDGYTLHLESVLSDKTSFYVKLNLFAPAGVVIPYEEDHRFDEIRILESGEEIPWEYWGYSTLDDDTTDNHLEVIMQIRFTEGMDIDYMMSSEALTLEVTGLTKSYGIFFERKTDQLTEGTWAFALRFAAASQDTQKYELISDPVPCTMVKEMTGEETQIYVTSVCVRNLGVDMVYDYPDGADLERLYWLGVKLLRKDGSMERLLPSDASIHPDGTQITGYISFTADTPIILDELAYIEFPDGTQIPLA